MMRRYYVGFTGMIFDVKAVKATQCCRWQGESTINAACLWNTAAEGKVILATHCCTNLPACFSKQVSVITEKLTPVLAKANSEQ